jgi:Putative beta-barrel porin 2
VFRKGAVGLLVVSLGVCVYARPASAQADIGPDPNQVRVRFGPLWMNPTISLTNIGIDQNVFNDPPEKVPKRDFTFTVAPTTDLWIRLGRSWLTGRIVENLNWYQKYASERNANNTYDLNWKMPLSRFQLHAVSTYASVKDRPGFEIDARAPRTLLNYGGDVQVRALTKTYIGVSYAVSTTKFDSGATFLDVNLHDELNRESTTKGIAVRHQATPLTAFSITASQTVDSFDHTTLRNATSNSIAGGVTFDPLALIKGGVTIGYRDFRPTSALPEYTGLTAAANLSYVVFGTTRFAATVTRDVQYSFEDTEPYYLLTGITGSVAQQIYGPFDVVARAGHENLAYRDRIGLAVALTDRVDRVTSYGAGVGFHMGKDLRLGFNLDHIDRESPIADRRYKNFLFGSQITYGVP